MQTFTTAFIAGSVAIANGGIRRLEGNFSCKKDGAMGSRNGLLE